MAYIKNVWVDQNVERPKTYEFSENSDGSFTLVDSFGNITELGTPVNAVNMNHIEDALSMSDLTKYDSTVTYAQNEWVTGSVNGVKSIYASQVNNNLGYPLSNSTYWKKANLNLSLGSVGAIMLFGKAIVPTDWLICDGAAISRTTYSDLYSVIGTIYGSGNGSSTFNLPNMIDKFIYGTRSVGATTSQTSTNTGQNDVSHQHAYVAGQYGSMNTGINNQKHKHTYLKGVAGIGLLPIIRYR